MELKENQDIQFMDLQTSDFATNAGQRVDASNAGSSRDDSHGDSEATDLVLELGAVIGRLDVCGILSELEKRVGHLTACLHREREVRKREQLMLRRV